MISLTITTDNISDVIQFFDTVQIRRYIGLDSTPEELVTAIIA